MRLFSLGLAGAIALSACDYSGAELFPGPPEGLEPIQVITAEDGSEFIVPIDLDTASLSDVRAAAIYGEVVPTGGVELAGLTFGFEGTGDSVCVWMDVETVSWSQSIAPTDGNRFYAYPDNTFDDGDIDLAGGLSVFYTGSPGVEMGDFEVRYTDALGFTVPIFLEECKWQGGTNILDNENPVAGVGTPDFCDFATTEVGKQYTVAATVFSTPLDDDRLGYAFVLGDGTCSQLQNLASAAFDDPANAIECLLLGESLKPEGDGGPYYGFDASRAWPGSVDFERHYCDGKNLRRFCNDELDAVFEAGEACSIADPAAGPITLGGDEETRCFCGDPTSIPEIGPN